MEIIATDSDSSLGTLSSIDSPQTAWKRNHDNVGKFQQQQQQQQKQQQQNQNNSLQQRGIKMGTASLSKSTASPQLKSKPSHHHQQQQQQPVPSVRKQTPPSPSSSPVKLPPKTKIRQKVRDYDSTDVYENQTEDEMIDIDPSVTDADETGGYFRNLAMIRLAILQGFRVTGLFAGQYNTIILHTSRCLLLIWRINKLLLPHNLYSGAKHISLFYCSCWHPFIVIRLQETIRTRPFCSAAQ